MIPKRYSYRYIKDRLNLYFYEKKNPKYPWLTKGVIEFLDQYLKRTDIFLETGSGRSTLWFASRVKKIISVEHHESWFQHVEKMIVDAKVDNVEYFLCDNNYQNTPYDSPYVNKIAEMKDNSLDAILVDGKHRGEIALISLSKIKQGGIIIIDNIEREIVLDVRAVNKIHHESQIKKPFQEFLSKTNQFRRVVFDNGVSSTMVMFID